MKPAACHPDRPHVAKGRCKVCYNREHHLAVRQAAVRKESVKRAQRKWKTSATGRAATLLAQARVNAKTSGREFDLDASDVIIPTHCPVLGIPLDCAAERHSDSLPSLDRIDNSKGYVKGNVWVISWRANCIKKDATLDELRALVKALETNGSAKELSK